MKERGKGQKLLSRGGRSPEYIFKFCVAGELVFLLVLYEVLHFI